MAAVRARQACKLLVWARLGPSSAAPDALRGAVPPAGCPPLARVVGRRNSTWALAEARLEGPAALLQKEEDFRLQERILQQLSQCASPDATSQARATERVAAEHVAAENLAAEPVAAEHVAAERVEHGAARLVEAAASHQISASDSSQSDESQEPAASPKSTNRRKKGEKPKAEELSLIAGEGLAKAASKLKSRAGEGATAGPTLKSRSAEGPKAVADVESLPGEVPTGEAATPVTPQLRAEVLAQLGLTEVDLVKRPKLAVTVDKALKSGYLEENVKALRSYGFTDYDLRRVAITSREAFSRNPSSVAAVLAYFAEFHFVDRRFAEFCVLSKCLSFDLKKSIKPKVEELNRIEAGGATWLLSKKPQVLHWSKETLRQNAAQLAAWVGPAEATALIQSQPTVILCSAVKLQNNGEIIQQLIGADLFRGFICKNPRMMSSATECLHALIRTLQPRFRFTAEEWTLFLRQAPWVNQKDPSRALEVLSSVFEERDLRSMALRVPSIFTTSADTIKASLQRCEGAAPGEAKALILKNPHLLCLNWAERVEPVLAYLESRCGVDPRHVLRKRTVPRNLNGWVKPRVEFLLDRGYHIVASAAEAADEAAAAAMLKQEGSDAAPGMKDESSDAAVMKDEGNAGKGMVPIHPIMDMALKRFQKRFPEYSAEVELEFRRSGKDIYNKQEIPGIGTSRE